jgi:hypothetical protein
MQRDEELGSGMRATFEADRANDLAHDPIEIRVQGGMAILAEDGRGRGHDANPRGASGP